MKQTEKQIHDNKTQQHNADNSEHVRILSHLPAAKHFRPSLLLTVLAALLMLLTARLAVWQFERAEQKAALEQNARQGLLQQPLAAAQDSVLRPHRRGLAVGVYLPSRQILLDNRVLQHIAGRHVITPLQLADGRAVAVNRGWLKNHAAVPAPPPGIVTVRGIWQKDQARAFTLSEQTEQDGVWQNLDLQKYAAATGLPMLTLALLAQDGGGTLIPVPVRIDYKSAQSTIYAWQWLSFCLLTLVFYIVLSFRKS